MHSEGHSQAPGGTLGSLNPELPAVHQPGPHLGRRSDAAEQLSAVAWGGGVVGQGLGERGGFREVSLSKPFGFGSNIWFRERI